MYLTSFKYFLPLVDFITLHGPLEFTVLSDVNKPVIHTQVGRDIVNKQKSNKIQKFIVSSIQLSKHSLKI